MVVRQKVGQLVLTLISWDLEKRQVLEMFKLSKVTGSGQIISPQHPVFEHLHSNRVRDKMKVNGPLVQGHKIRDRSTGLTSAAYRLVARQTRTFDKVRP